MAQIQVAILKIILYVHICTWEVALYTVPTSQHASPKITTAYECHTFRRESEKRFQRGAPIRMRKSCDKYIQSLSFVDASFEATMMHAKNVGHPFSLRMNN